MHNQAMTMDGPRLKQPRFNTKKKLMIYIALAAIYLIVVMVAGLVMDPEMYGGSYISYDIAGRYSEHIGNK